MKKQTLSLAELAHRPSLTIPETMRLTGYSRPRVDDLIDKNEFRWFKEGAGEWKRVITASIFEYQERQAALSMGAAS